LLYALQMLAEITAEMAIFDRCSQLCLRVEAFSAPGG
jgi:hypothetical protein